MIPVILAVAAGVTIGAGIIGFICDELSESEREKQREMKQEYERYEKNRLDNIYKYDLFKEQSIEHNNQRFENEAERLRRLQYQILWQKRQELLNYYRETVNQRIEEKSVLLDELRDTIQLVIKTKKNQNTMLRINALDQLIRELQEAQEKLNAYIIYLNKYRNHLRYFESPDITPPEPFDFILPAEFLYKGKLVYWKKSEIKEHGSIPIKKMGELKYHFAEFDFIKDYDENALIPLMGGYFNLITFETEVSAKKGIFQNVVTNNPRIGIKAEVIRYSERGEIELNYNNAIQLKLPKRNLANPKRTPPIGAFLRVFPVKWDFSLPANRMVEVSEKASDSLLNYAFEDIPLVLSEARWNELEDYLHDNSLLERKSEWKIAPFDETEIPNVKKVKFQLGTDLILLASFATDGINSYFVYESILDLSFSLKPEDIFVAIDCTLNLVLDYEIGELDDSVYENMNNLSIMVFSEFKLQYQTKISQNGMQYFNKWSEITDKLITYLYKGRSIEVNIAYIDTEVDMDRNVRVYFENPLQVEDYLEKVYADAVKKSNVEFFIEMKAGEYAFVDINPDCEYMKVYDKGVWEFLNSGPSSIRIFNKYYCYAEYQQSAALHQFRLGKLANPYLQVCALDSSNITRDTQDWDIEDFFNKGLLNDLSQREAVENVLSENNIYLIQGPPGTGKTTVIREIIMQYIAKNEFSNILVVSQANVAVDNVLKGFIQNIPKNVVRCGKADRIGEDIIHISFEKKYRNYVEKILAKKNSGADSLILDRWLQIVDSDHGYNPDVGELIIKGHRIVGATCVGLAKRRIGLDRMVFDLVIIDEAGKALPAETLIPYVKAKKVVLIGDHIQLPPTLNVALFDESKIEIDDRDIYEDELFNKSFFEKMFERAPETNKCMLTTQYRMPSLIGSLVSKLFYNSAITNGLVTVDKKPIYFESSLNLIDMSNDKEYIETTKNAVSVTNNKEAELVCALIYSIRKRISPQKARIAVITPYKGQKRLIVRTMLNNGMDIALNNIDINTIDAFQGDEAEMVIFCSTRAARPTKFFSDYRRINVALSRAMNELIIIGSLSYFYRFSEEDSVLPQIADYIKTNGQIINPEDLILCDYERSSVDDFDVISINSILITKDFSMPKREKVDAVIQYFYEHGDLDKPLVVCKSEEGYILVDKYLRYVVAKELGLTEVKVIVQ